MPKRLGAARSRLDDEQALRVGVHAGPTVPELDAALAAAMILELTIAEPLAFRPAEMRARRETGRVTNAY